MTEKMLKFVNIDMQMPSKRTTNLRTEDFKEIYKKTEYYCSDFDGKTVIICGGAGFLGSLFVKYFLFLVLPNIDI